MKALIHLTIYFFCGILFYSCDPNPELVKELEACQKRHKESVTKLNRIRQQQAKFTPNLFHIVYFDLKDNLRPQDIKLFRASLEMLGAIDEVGLLNFGEYTDLGDDRAMKGYEYVMYMGFNDEEGYRRYQNDERHMDIRSNLKQYLAGPPVTYDFLAVKE